jgi:hypothetical protein
MYELERSYPLVLHSLAAKWSAGQLVQAAIFYASVVNIPPS